MIQSKKEGGEVYKVGCLGKISDFQKSNDGRILINLSGITRFEVLEEKKNSKLYREFRVNYDKFTSDLEPSSIKINTDALLKKTKIFFNNNGLILNWKEFQKLDDTQKINTLSMIAPITNEEKQKLLESISFDDKIATLEKIINFYLYETRSGNKTIQ